MDVLFVKASNERAARFRLLTKVCENENGVRTVIKSPCSIHSWEHVNELAETCLKLEKYYQESELTIVPCEIQGHDAVFPFIVGKSMDEELYKLVRERNKESFLTLFRSLLHLIEANIEIVDFKKCEAYCRIFGDVALPEGVPALALANIDIIPANIIIDNNNRWHLIDYEWVFDFPVPVEYIAYRSICVFQFNHDLKELFQDKELYSRLGLELDHLKVFQEMDRCFSCYIKEESNHPDRWISVNQIYTISDLFADRQTKSVLQDRNTILSNEIDELTIQNEKLTIQNEKQNDTISELNAQLKERETQLSALQQLYMVKSADYDAINNAFFWRITGPLRKIIVKMKHIFHKSTIAHKLWYALKHLINIHPSPKMLPVPEHTSELIEKKSPSADTDLICCDIYYPPESLYEMLSGKPIDVILPVYNGRTILPPLLESIPRTKVPYRLILVDDKSTDGQILPMLRAYAEERDNVELLENETNIGYTRSVNEAFRITNGHVVLLNSDIRLPEYWLERLIMPILTDKKVCSATPFTNSGTICSFPNFCQDNDIYMGLSVDEIDAVFSRLRPRYTKIPTGVGFCMALSRNALEKIGFYDEDSFPRGYGEENDWCQRAKQAGFYNVMVENLFVYHQHGASFTSNEKKKLIEQNLQIINKEYPNYFADVQNYIEADPVSAYRETSRMILYAANTMPVLAFDHEWGGGATIYLHRKIKESMAAGLEVIIIRYSTDNGYVLVRTIDGIEYSACAASLEQLFGLLPDKLRKIWINELVTYPNLSTTMHAIIDLAQKSGAEVEFFLHDYYCICPHYKLLDNSGHFCGVCDPVDCKHNCDPLMDIEGWRRKWNSFLAACDDVIAFSKDSLNHIHQCYPNLDNIRVIPHKVPSLRVVESHTKTDELTIGVIGAISVEKGLKIIEEMAQIIRSRQLPVSIKVIGYTAYDLADKETISVTGRYQLEELPDILEENKVDVILIPSIWPETFSFTTSEAISMGLPVACFNIGAPVERVEQYGKGLIIPEITAEAALNTIYNYWKSELCTE